MPISIIDDISPSFVSIYKCLLVTYVYEHFYGDFAKIIYKHLNCILCMQMLLVYSKKKDYSFTLYFILLLYYYSYYSFTL